ncbi:GNAT family N-acetyltransferase [Pseudomonas matsuisoli]|nr:GNAT family N-acetyltransferase [Pseudomonas matsuisoli]
MTSLLRDSVAAGASIGFLANVTDEELARYLNEVGERLSRGDLVVWAAEREEALVGSVQLSLITKANGLNRAEVQKLLVHSRARRLGIATALMQAVERHARGIGRRLLYLDTLAHSDAERLYQRLAYQRVGEIPDYAADPKGHYCATALYYKQLTHMD